VRALGAGRSAEQQSYSRNYRTGRNKRIPKRSALDPRIKKALQSSARKLPDRKLASAANAVIAPAGLLWAKEVKREGRWEPDEALSSKAIAETIVPAGMSGSRSEAPWIRA